MNHPRISHAAVVPVVGHQTIDQSGQLYPVYAEACAVCGRKVRRMSGLGPRVFHHAGSGRPPGPHTPEHRAAIAKGMVEANARRRAARA